MKVTEKIAVLRNLMQQDGIDYYYIPTNDFHGSEYVADYFKCREYMSGFTGSAGSLLVSATEAGLWTDGRYFLQAEAQLAGSGITLYRMGEPGVPKIFEYIAQHIQPGQCLGFDGRMVDAFYALQLKKIVESKGARLVTEFDLVGAVWYNRPWLEAKPAYSLSTQYTGVERGEKLDAICKWLDTRKADMLVITSLDDIAWALNIRGEDIHCCPVVLSYLVIKPLERILFANKSAFSTRLRQELARDSVLLREYDEIYDYLAAVPAGSPCGDGHACGELPACQFRATKFQDRQCCMPDKDDEGSEESGGDRRGEDRTYQGRCCTCAVYVLVETEHPEDSAHGAPCRGTA